MTFTSIQPRWTAASVSAPHGRVCRECRCQRPLAASVSASLAFASAALRFSCTSRAAILSAVISRGMSTCWHFAIQAMEALPAPAEPAASLADVELLLVTVVVDPVVIVTVDVGVRTSLDGHAVLVAQVVVRFLKWHSVSIHPIGRGRYICVCNKSSFI